ncbi:conserved hypothetical protein [Hyphomicrobiales bacterium]|nr:conserved hypothetical protein [Hyphomicrobiales bacterium]CAH1665634.1 conserved hypothetical protein [Hyphomicrobiales bacterium]
MAVIVKSFDDSYIFSDSFYNKHAHPPTRVSRLTLSAHGVEGAVLIDGKRMNALDLWDLCHRLVAIDAFDYIRIGSCHSARGGSASLACRLSKIFERGYVKGYMRSVWTLGQPDQISFAIKQYGMDSASMMLNSAMLKEPFIQKNDDEFHSMLFRRGVMIKEKIFSPYGR